MRGPAAIVVAVAIGLGLPVCAQHNGAQTGSSGHGGGTAHFGGAGHGRSMQSRGFTGYAGAPNYSGLTGLQSPSSFSAPGRFPMPGQLQPPPRVGGIAPYSGQPFRTNGAGFSGPGSGYGYGHAGDRHRAPYRGRDRDHDGDRDRHERHRNRGSYGYGYAPGYVYPYPVVVDPGFYDWGATDYSEDQSGNAAGRAPYPGPEYAAESAYPASDVPYPQQENPQPSSASVPPQRQEYHFAAQPSTSSRIEPPLKVIFKGGRTPVSMQNYMVNATSLTDLDADHFEKIPLEQVDVAATQEANRSHGIDFQVPIASRD